MVISIKKCLHGVYIPNGIGETSRYCSGCTVQTDPLQPRRETRLRVTVEEDCFDLLARGWSHKEVLAYYRKSEPSKLSEAMMALHLT